MNKENKLGIQIKQQRKLLGLTQEQLAEKAGIDNKHLSKIENGLHLPTYKTIKKLSEILQIEICNSKNIEVENSIPTDTTFIEITKIYTSAKTTKEKNYYLEVMKLAQKGLNINS